MKMKIRILFVKPKQIKLILLHFFDPFVKTQAEEEYLKIIGK